MRLLRNFYQKFALVLFPLRRWLVLLTLGSALMSILLIFVDAGISQRYLLPSLVITLWFLFSVSLAYYANSTRLASRPQGFFRRIAWSARKAWTQVLALMFLLATLGLLYISMVAVRLALAS